MRHSRYLLLLLLVIAVVAAGCGGGVLGSAQLAAIVSSYFDPTGGNPATTGTAYDILKVVSQRIDNSPFGSYDTLRTEITFNTAPTLPPAGTYPDAGNELAFRVYFDTNQDPTTGFQTNGMCGTLGIEFWVDGTILGEGGPSRQTNGNYQVISDATGFPSSGEATVSTSGNVLAVNVPLTALGGDDGQTNMSVRIGNGVDNALDCGPHTGGAVVTRNGPVVDKR